MLVRLVIYDSRSTYNVDFYTLYSSFESLVLYDMHKFRFYVPNASRELITLNRLVPWPVLSSRGIVLSFMIQYFFFRNEKPSILHLFFAELKLWQFRANSVWGKAVMYCGTVRYCMNYMSLNSNLLRGIWIMRFLKPSSWLYRYWKEE